MDKKLQGKVAVVTGAASGIGEATARAFAAADARLVLADLSLGPLRQVETQLRDGGSEVLAVETDVSDPESVRRLFAQALKEFAAIDILFNGAGILFHGTALETDDATWNRLIAVNLTGTFLCCREVLPHMIERGRGSIINVSSTTGGHDAAAKAAAYVCSKGGVAMLTKALAVDHARQGVRVNALCPGPTDTPMLRKIMSGERLVAFTDSFPMGRLGRPEEIASAALFLAGEDSSFVTGSLLTVDGGQTAEV